MIYIYINSDVQNTVCRVMTTLLRGLQTKKYCHQQLLNKWTVHICVRQMSIHLNNEDIFSSWMMIIPDKK